MFGNNRARVGACLLILAGCLLSSQVRGLAQAPANDNFANAQSLTGASGSLAGVNTSATREPGEPSHAGDPGGASVWYKWTSPTSASVTFTTNSSSFDTLLAIYTGSSVDALTPIASNNDDLAGYNTSKLSFPALAGATYYIAVDGAAGATGNIVLSWAPTPANDSFSTPQAITGASGSLSSTNAGASKETGEPYHAGDNGGSSVWYQWTAPTGGNITFTTSRSGFDTLLAVYTGASVNTLAEVISNNDDPNGGSTSTVSFSAAAGTTYLIAVDGLGGATGVIQLAWSFPPSNDNFLDARALTGKVGSVTGSNVAASKEIGEPDHAGAAGGVSVWYRWTSPVTGSATFDTSGSNFDTLLGVYTGSPIEALIESASNDDASSSTTTSKVTFPVAAGTTYYIAVDGSSGAMGEVVLNWLATWRAIDLAVGSDNSVRLLWDQPDGAMALWSVDSAFNFSSSSAYGPYTGWLPTCIAAGAGTDGLTRELWNQPDGTAALWLIGANNVYQPSYSFGPYPLWTAMDIASASDNQARILWSKTDGHMALWSVDNNGVYTSSNAYGPYHGWSPTAIAAGSDGLSRVLWNNIDGSAAVWTLTAANVYQSSYSFGPYPGWTAVDIAVGSDNKARILWINTNGSIIVWTVDSSGGATYGPVYGPYPGYSAQRITAGADGYTRILWYKTDGAAVLWRMGSDNTYQVSVGYGPF